MTTATATKTTSLGPMQQVDAGVLDVGYAEAGPADGPARTLTRSMAERAGDDHGGRRLTRDHGPQPEVVADVIQTAAAAAAHSGKLETAAVR